MVRDDRLFQSIQPQIEEKVASFVEEALRKGCPYLKVSCGHEIVLMYFRNGQGQLLTRRLNFKEIYHNAGCLRIPLRQIAEYAFAFALKDSRIEHAAAAPRWNNVSQARQFQEG